ncbi:MAG: hypothetical protein ACKOUT_09190 [Novosphingobium sp.]
MRFFTKALWLIPVAGLHACAVSTPVRVAVPHSAALPETVSLDIGPQASPALAAFAADFTRELAKGGTRVSEGAPFHLTLALSAQPSQSGVTSDSGSNPKAVSWQSLPRRKSMFDNCQPERLRAVVVGNQGLSASPPLVAEAELDSCKDSAAEFGRLAAALASAITRR